MYIFKRINSKIKAYQNGKALASNYENKWSLVLSNMRTCTYSTAAEDA